MNYGYFCVLNLTTSGTLETRISEDCIPDPWVEELRDYDDKEKEDASNLRGCEIMPEIGYASTMWYISLRFFFSFHHISFSSSFPINLLTFPPSLSWGYRMLICTWELTCPIRYLLFVLKLNNLNSGLPMGKSNILSFQFNH